MSVEELKKLYEEDCKHSDEPWQWWQIKSITESGWWPDLQSPPVWSMFEYRRKPDAPDWNAPIPHCHAENMALYAEDAKLSARPWDKWETRRKGMAEAAWWKCVSHPAWGKDQEFRRRPDFFAISEVEVPYPVTSSLKKGTVYYVPELGNASSFVVRHRWKDGGGSDDDHARLESGLIQLTLEGALKLREALLKPLRGALQE